MPYTDAGRLFVIASVLMGSIAAPARAAASDVHSIDFRNFAYVNTPCGEDGTPVTVKNGVYEKDAEDDRVYFKVQDISYGDLTGDGSDEAVISTLCNTGGTGEFTDALIYSMRGGKPVQIATLGVGDRADGGLFRARVRDGLLYEERFGQDGTSGACCPQFVETTAERWNGTHFVASGPTTKRAFVDYDLEDSPAPHSVHFLRGTSSALLVGQTNGKQSYSLGARAGQTLALTFETKDPTAEVLVSGATGQPMKTARMGESASVALPASGTYTIAIHSKKGADDADTYYDLDLSVR